MHTRVSRYAAIFLVLASSASIACSDDSETAATSITGERIRPRISICLTDGGTGDYCS